MLIVLTAYGALLLAVATFSPVYKLPWGISVWSTIKSCEWHGNGDKETVWIWLFNVGHLAINSQHAWQLPSRKKL